MKHSCRYILTLLALLMSLTISAADCVTASRTSISTTSYKYGLGNRYHFTSSTTQLCTIDNPYKNLNSITIGLKFNNSIATQKYDIYYKTATVTTWTKLSSNSISGTSRKTLTLDASTYPIIAQVTALAIKFTNYTGDGLTTSYAGSYSISFDYSATFSPYLYLIDGTNNTKTLDFGTIDGSETKTLSFTFNYKTLTNLSWTMSGANASNFSFPTPAALTSNCSNSQTISVTFNPNGSLGEMTATLTGHSTDSGTEDIVITLKGVATGTIDPAHTWDETIVNAIHYVDDTPFSIPVTSTNDIADLQYSIIESTLTGTNNEGQTSTITASGVFTSACAGIYKVQVRQTQTAIDAYSTYNEYATTRVIKVIKRPTNITWKTTPVWNLNVGESVLIPLSPDNANAAVTTDNTATALAYSIPAGNTLWLNEENRLLIGLQAGDASVTVSQAETRVYEAGNAAVTFHVAKADPALTWKITSPLREGTEISNFVESTNTITPLQISITAQSRTGLVEYDATTDVLTINDILSKGESATFTISVKQDANEYYNALPATTKTFTVLYRSEVCIEQFSSLNKEAFEESLMQTKGKVYWCNEDKTNVRETWGRIFHPTHNEFRGVAMGDWSEGLDLSFAETVYDIKEFVFSFYGVPDKLYLTTKTQTVTYVIDYGATNIQWEVLYSINGSTFTSIRNVSSNLSNTVFNIPQTARYIKIRYKGNFTGYITAMRLTRRRSLSATPAELVFADASHPLHEPQGATVAYSSIGTCDEMAGSVSVAVVDGAEWFQVDENILTDHVNIDQYGSATVHVRCSALGKTGTLRFTSSDSPTLTADVTLRSLTPDITPTTDAFYTGTERAYEDDTYYYGLRELTFTNCFDAAAQTRFDSLYLFGVTRNTDARFSGYDPTNTYMLPVIDAPDEVSVGCNALTPCFVFCPTTDHRSYTLARQFYASSERLGDINAANKNLYFAGYLPFAYTGASAIDAGFCSFTNTATPATTDVYLEMLTAYSRYHTTNGCGAKEQYIPTYITLYLGQNYINASGALFTAKQQTALNIHLLGNNTLRAAPSMYLSSVTALSRDISLTVNDLKDYIVPSAAIAYIPHNGDDAWQLNVNTDWFGEQKIGQLQLTGSRGAGSIDLGTEWGTLTTSSDDAIVSAVVDASGDRFHDVQQVGCRQFMAEKAGQGFSLYGVGDGYQPSTAAWTAALPGYGQRDATDGQQRLLYADVLGGGSDFTNRDDYQVAQHETLILTATADTWQTMVAPFDITDIYVLELMPESMLSEAADKETALMLQRTQTNRLMTHLKTYITESGKAADKSFVIILSDWIGEQRDNDDAALFSGYKANYNLRGLWQMTPYDGTNIWTADYYLSELDSEDEAWQVGNDDPNSSFTSSWRYPTRRADGVIMQKGKTYAWQLPYCAHCTDNDAYDYWTDKWIVFEGYGEQTIDGTNTVETNMSARAAAATTSTALFSGNTALTSMTLPQDAFVHDTDPASDTYDYFVSRRHGETLPALTPCIFMRSPEGRRLSAISRMGKAIYTQTGSTVATSVEEGTAVSNKSRKVIIDNSLYIVVGDSLYDVLGRRL